MIKIITDERNSNDREKSSAEKKLIKSIWELLIIPIIMAFSLDRA
jgi:hypothetical protein